MALDSLKKFALRWGSAVLVMELIFFFSSLPMKHQPLAAGLLTLIADILLKKGGHLLGYALLALSLGAGISVTDEWACAGVGAEWGVRQQPFLFLLLLAGVLSV